MPPPAAWHHPPDAAASLPPTSSMHQHCGSHWGAVSHAKCSRARRAGAGAPAGRRAALQRWQGALRFRWTTTHSELAARMVTGCKGAATCLSHRLPASCLSAKGPVPSRAHQSSSCWQGLDVSGSSSQTSQESRAICLPQGSPAGWQQPCGNTVTLTPDLPGERAAGRNNVPSFALRRQLATDSRLLQPATANLPVGAARPLNHACTHARTHARTHAYTHKAAPCRQRWRSSPHPLPTCLRVSLACSCSTACKEPQAAHLARPGSCSKGSQGSAPSHQYCVCV